jgi:hypothetical protein
MDVQFAEARGEPPMLVRIRVWPSKKSTCRSATADLSFATTVSDNGRARSTPVTSPPIAGVSGATAKPTLGAFMAKVSSAGRSEKPVVALVYIIDRLN